MRYEPDNDELMDAVLLEVQIQLCVGETHSEHKRE